MSVQNVSRLWRRVFWVWALMLMVPLQGAHAAGLQLASVHALAVDLDSGEQLFAKHADVPAPIASVTKLMTALVVLDSGAPLDEWLTVLERDRPAPANAWSRLRIDSEATRGDLLRIALMSSENLASHVLGRHYPGGLDAFVEAMNARARELGMQDTRFVDTTGLSAENVSTAADLGRLLAAAWQEPVIREYSTTPTFSVRFRNPGYTLSYGNTNRLVHNGRWNVGLTKTGYLNAAGRCLAMVTEIDERPVAMVLLNSFGTHTPLGDAGRLRRWLEDGTAGQVAGPALAYEQEQVAACCRAPVAGDEGGEY